MSSAILYVAIVAIWAVFLIPAWIKRPHVDSDTRSGESFSDETGEQDEMTGEDLYETQRPRHRVEFIEDPFEDDCLADIEPANPPASLPAETDLEYAYDGEYAAERAPRPREHSLGGRGGRSSAPPPPQNREQMLRARRSLLMILLGLTVITAAATVAGLVHWWICVPPAALLAFYLLLLREIGAADAELARKRTAYEAHLARMRGSEYQQAWEDQPEEPAAEVIDISDRVGDQLFDQYEDAEVRAVGD